MSKTNFEKLRVYQLSEILADEIWAIVDALASNMNAYLKSIGKIP